MNISDYLDEEKALMLLTLYGAKKIEKTGEILRCACFLHDSDNDSTFVYNTKTNLWYCHVECIGGDIIKLHAMANDLSDRHDFAKVVDELCSMLGINKADIDLSKMEYDRRKDLREWMAFSEKKKYKDVVNKEYELDLLGTMKKLGGYRGFSAELLNNNNVVYAREMERIAFILQDENGVVVGATCRRVNDNVNPKWLHRPKGIDTGYLLYNLDKIKDKGYTSVYVVEGVVDVLAYLTLGVENVVATFGCNITEEQIELLQKYFTDIILSYDNDTAGMNGNIKAIDKTNKKFNVLVYDFYESSYNDIDDILKSGTVLNAYEVIHSEIYLEKYKKKEGN